MTSPSPTATCPRCNSPSLQAVPVKRTSIASAVLAEYALGTAAGVAASSDTVIRVVCLNCGCAYVPGTIEERTLRALSGQLGEQARVEAEQRLRTPAGYVGVRKADPGRVWAARVALALIVIVAVVAMISR
jgi:hypothetical protein